MQDTEKKHSAKFKYKLTHEQCSKNVLLHCADKFPEKLKLLAPLKNVPKHTYAKRPKTIKIVVFK